MIIQDLQNDGDQHWPEKLNFKSRVEERQPLSWESQENMEQWQYSLGKKGKSL